MRRFLHLSRWLLGLFGSVVVVVSAHADGMPMPPRTVKSSWTAAPAGKANGSGVRLSYLVPANLQPGQIARVELRFSGVAVDDARVNWRAPAGSTVTSQQVGAATSMTLPVGEVTTITLDITPAADGMAYLDVFTAQGGRASAQSVPLKVGSGKVAMKREGTVQTAPSGERVISLPSTPR